MQENSCSVVLCFLLVRESSLSFFLILSTFLMTNLDLASQIYDSDLSVFLLLLGCWAFRVELWNTNSDFLGNFSIVITKVII